LRFCLAIGAGSEVFSKKIKKVVDSKKTNRYKEKLAERRGKKKDLTDRVKGATKDGSLAKKETAGKKKRLTKPRPIRYKSKFVSRGGNKAASVL